MLLRKVYHFLIVLLNQSECQDGTLICQLHVKKSLFWHGLWILCGKPETGQVARIMRFTHNNYQYKIRKFRINKYFYLNSYLHKVDVKTYSSSLCLLCNIYTHNTHYLFNCIHIGTTLSPLDLWTDPAGVTALLAR